MSRSRSPGQTEIDRVREGVPFRAIARHFCCCRPFRDRGADSDRQPVMASIPSDTRRYAARPHRPDGRHADCTLGGMTATSSISISGVWSRLRRTGEPDSQTPPADTQPDTVNDTTSAGALAAESGEPQTHVEDPPQPVAPPPEPVTAPRHTRRSTIGSVAWSETSGTPRHGPRAGRKKRTVANRSRTRRQQNNRWPARGVRRWTAGGNRAIPGTALQT